MSESGDIDEPGPFPHIIVEFVHQTPSLWNLADPRYKDREYKRRKWEECAKAAKYETWDHAYKAWVKIRDSCAKYANKMRTAKSGSGASTSIPPAFFEELEFYRKATKERAESTSSLMQNASLGSGDESPTLSDIAEAHDMFYSQESFEVTDETQPIESPRSLNGTQPIESSSSVTSVSVTPPKIGNRKRTRNSGYTRASDFEERLLHVLEPKTENAQSTYELRGMLLGKQISELKPSHQSYVFGKLNELMMLAEKEEAGAVYVSFN
ncbi:hypothetical protein M3Y98_00974100 [Aphelenchoides besseyi]|nr:hypothetical protein M3Y98_00974100 [Aphelenchoides besseyi]